MGKLDCAFGSCEILKLVLELLENRSGWKKAAMVSEGAIPYQHSPVPEGRHAIVDDLSGSRRHGRANRCANLFHHLASGS